MPPSTDTDSVGREYLKQLGYATYEEEEESDDESYSEESEDDPEAIDVNEESADEPLPETDQTVGRVYTSAAYGSTDTRYRGSLRACSWPETSPLTSKSETLCAMIGGDDTFPFDMDKLVFSDQPEDATFPYVSPSGLSNWTADGDDGQTNSSGTSPSQTTRTTPTRSTMPISMTTPTHSRAIPNSKSPCPSEWTDTSSAQEDESTANEPPFAFEDWLEASVLE
ncbi:hypothetical protein BN946_scf184786.g2 [Trametes cinnabarina]|uniref:Uncharacterized protein n=1 Tax=Pycnoporus cinnabarinus TaxID=5643 RepID=A0A060SS53_PYCCI|nr:hypothetical protein BN946_scf184786.g2 [Trametes cinnabarina]